MENNELLNQVIGLFIIAPWWLKLILIGIVLLLLYAALHILAFIIYIPAMPIKAIKNNIDNKKSEKERSEREKLISELIDKDSQSAIKKVENYRQNQIIQDDEYIQYLEKIAAKTEDTMVMVKLYTLYGDEKMTSSLGKEKRKSRHDFWYEKTLHLGHLETIIEHYGFTDSDLSSKDYEQILIDLDKAETNPYSETNNAKYPISYLRGLTYYKMGNIDQAKKIFQDTIIDEKPYLKEFMLLECAKKENDFETIDDLISRLEKINFDIPSSNYIFMFEYYHSANDLKNEIRYIDKYIKSKDADANVIVEKCSLSYFNYAESLMNGTNGLQKDEEKAAIIYEKAAELGSKDALFHIGYKLWIGEPRRDYRKANDYLLRATKSGNPDAALFIEKYGIDGILVRTEDDKKLEYQFLDNYKLTADSNSVKWIYMFFGAKNKRTAVANEFNKTYKANFKSFEQLVNNIHSLYIDSIAKMLQWSVKLLISFGIDEYSEEDILNECEDLDLYSRVPWFTSELERIDNRARQLNADLNYAKASRRTWTGAGYGSTIGSAVKASIKANITAGAMNFGSSILHGVGDKIVESMNNKELKEMGDKVFNNPKTVKVFTDAVFSSCLEIIFTVANIIENHSEIKLNLIGDIVYDGKNLSDIKDETLKTKIKNNLSIGNHKYVYAMLVESLRRNPFDYEVLTQLLLLTIAMAKDNNVKEDFFRVLNVYLTFISDFDLYDEELLSILDDLKVAILDECKDDIEISENN